MAKIGERYKNTNDGKTREVVAIEGGYIELRCVNCQVVPSSISSKVQSIVFESDRKKGTWVKVGKKK
jgi:hypothetical protein